MAIDKQCQLMEAQKAALQLLQFRRSHDNNAAHSQRLQKLAREKAQTEFEVHELAGSLRSTLKTASKQVDGVLNKLPSSVEKLLDKDDRLLDGLQTISPRLHSDGKLADDTEVKFDFLCQTLVALTVQETRLRLDAVYKSAASIPSSTPTEHNDAADRQRNSLQAELDELSSEIDSLATMAVDAQYRLPITQSLQTSNSDQESEQARWSIYVLSTIQYLTTRLEALEEQYDSLTSHRAAVQTVQVTLSDILASPAPSRHDQIPQSAITVATPRGLKPLRLLHPNNNNQSEDPTSQLLRHLEIRFSDSTDDTVKLPLTLQHTKKERALRLADLERTTAHSFSKNLTATIGKADADATTLLGAVHAYSEYGTVKVVATEVETGIGRLEREVGVLGEDMRGLDVGVLGRRVRA